MFRNFETNFGLRPEVFYKIFMTEFFIRDEKLSKIIKQSHTTALSRIITHLLLQIITSITTLIINANCPPPPKKDASRATITLI